MPGRRWLCCASAGENCRFDRTRDRLLEPARVGWNVIDDHEHTFCRRWVRRPDKMLEDPFGQRTVRANMHPGYQNPDAISAPAGPVDPALTVLSVQSRNGRPIAVLANYSMHYYGAEPVSADYFGRFAGSLAKRINAQSVEPPFVGIMSQGSPAVTRCGWTTASLQERAGPRRLRRRGRSLRPPGVPVDYLSRLGSTGDGPE